MGENRRSAETMPRHWLVLLGIASVTYVVAVYVVGLFQIGHGDEGAWLYQAWLTSLGLRPGLDFFSQHQAGFFLPYALAFKALSPGLEAGRLVSATFSLGTTVMATMLAWRRFGGFAAWIVFAATAFNVAYQWTVMSVYSVSPGIFGAVGAMFFVLYPRIPGFAAFAAAGLCAGFAMSARLPLALVALGIASFGLFGLPNLRWGRRVTLVAVASVFALLPLVPDILIFAGGFDRVFYTRIVAVNEYFDILLARDGVKPSLGLALTTILKALGEYAVSGAFFAPAQNIWPTAAFCLTLVLLVWRKIQTKSAVFSSGSIWCLVFCTLILAGNAAGWRLLLVSGSYFVAAVPFLALVLGSLTADLRRSGWGKAAMAVTVVLALPYVSMGVAHGAWQVLFRDAPGFSQPMTVAETACWLHSATSPEERVLSMWPASLVGAQRHMPAGMEAAGVLKTWYHLPLDRQRLAGIITAQDMRVMLEEGKIAVVLDDTFTDWLDHYDLPELSHAVRTEYVEIGRIGGNISPNRILVPRKFEAAVRRPLSNQSRDMINMRTLRSEGISVFLGGVVKTSLEAVLALPRDISNSLARAANGIGETVCNVPAG